jgi:uncharacterized peroxidase-related enzyme
MTDAKPTEFTLDLLTWTPWLDRATDTDLDPDKRSRVTAAVGTAPNSDYINVLANDLEALQTRALVHRHVFASDAPEDTARRELGATTTSRINGCVFCASVHARMWAHAEGNRRVAETFLRDGVDADLPPQERAIVDAAARLTTDPESLAPEHLEPLRAQGLDDDQILDALNYAAFFANANRLMLTLGEPKFARPSKSRGAQ